jgi:hypothetical protein
MEGPKMGSIAAWLRECMDSTSHTGTWWIGFREDEHFLSSESRVEVLSCHLHIRVLDSIQIVQSFTLQCKTFIPSIVDRAPNGFGVHMERWVR